MKPVKIIIFVITSMFIVTFVMAALKFTSPPTKGSGPSSINQSTQTMETVIPPKTPEVINSLADKEIQETLKTITMEFITAEYKGDTANLLELTKENAEKAVKSGELDIFKTHKFKQIVYFNFINNNPDEYLVIISLETQTDPNFDATTCFEHLTFKKIKNEFYITNIERDV